MKVVDKSKKSQNKFRVGVIYEPKRPDDKPVELAKFETMTFAQVFVYGLQSKVVGIAEVHIW